MKFKEYLGGFGAGIIVSASVLSVANAITAKPSTTENATSAYISYTITQEDGTKISIDSKKEDVKELESEVETKIASEEIKDETVTEATTKEVTTEAATQETQAATGEVTVEIPMGTSASGVFNKLQEAGVITDASDFGKYMYDNGYDTQIRIGTYTLKRGDSYANIAKTITHN